jgi:hypothetical protein
LNSSVGLLTRQTRAILLVNPSDPVWRPEVVGPYEGWTVDDHCCRPVKGESERWVGRAGAKVRDPLAIRRRTIIRINWMSKHYRGG